MNVESWICTHTHTWIYTPFPLTSLPAHTLALPREEERACVCEIEREGGDASEYNSMAGNAKLKCKGGWMAFCNVY